MNNSLCDYVSKYCTICYKSGHTNSFCCDDRLHDESCYCRCYEDIHVVNLQSSIFYRHFLLMKYDIDLDTRPEFYKEYHGEFYDKLNTIQFGLHNKENHRCIICGEKGYNHSLTSCPKLCQCIDKTILHLKKLIPHSKEQHYCKICKKLKFVIFEFFYILFNNSIRCVEVIRIYNSNYITCCYFYTLIHGII